MFWSDKIVNVEKRIPILRKYHDEKIFNKNDILKVFNEFLFKAYYADCPKMKYFCAKFYHQFAKDSVLNYGKTFI